MGGEEELWLQGGQEHGDQEDTPAPTCYWAGALNGKCHEPEDRRSQDYYSDLHSKLSGTPAPLSSVLALWP